MNPVSYKELHDKISVPMLQGSPVNHELYIRVSGKYIYDIIVMSNGIVRGGENDKTYDPAWGSPLWLDGAGIATYRTSPTGMGKSEGDTFQSTLSDRVSVTVEAAKYAKAQYPRAALTLAGASMGGHVVVRAAYELAQQGLIVENLILSSPCFYSDTAEKVAYGGAFKKAAALATTAQSLYDFKAMQQLLNFSGKVFMFYQEHEANMERGGVKDIDLVIKVATDIMEKRAAAGRDDHFFFVADGEHSFSSQGTSSDINTISTHPGSANKMRITKEAVRILNLGSQK